MHILSVLSFITNGQNTSHGCTDFRPARTYLLWGDDPSLRHRNERCKVSACAPQTPRLKQIIIQIITESHVKTTPLIPIHQDDKRASYLDPSALFDPPRILLGLLIDLGNLVLREDLGELDPGPMNQPRARTDENTQPRGRDGDEPADDGPHRRAQARGNAGPDAGPRGPPLHPSGLEAAGRLEQPRGLLVDLAGLGPQVLGELWIVLGYLLRPLVEADGFLLQTLRFLYLLCDFLQQLFFGRGSLVSRRIITLPPGSAGISF